MAFVNEPIPEEDIKKYEIAKWDEKYLKGHYQPSWTVDRERDMYLRYICTGHEELCNRWTFSFYWKKYVLSVQLDSSGGGEWRGTQCRHYDLVRLMISLFDPLPESLEAHRPEILADLKEALIAFKDLGVLSSSTSHTATFNF